MPAAALLDDVETGLIPIEYRGGLAALVSRDRVHIVAPWLAVRPAGDPELRFVAYMCLAYAVLAADHRDGSFSSCLAERWARAALIDGDDLVRSTPERDADLAVRLNVPVDQIALARRDLSRGR
jgi:hypothetical protein